MFKTRYCALLCIAVGAALPALATTTAMTFSQWDTSTYIDTSSVTYDSLNCSGSSGSSSGLNCSGFNLTGPDGTGNWFLTSQDYPSVQYDPTGLRSNNDGIGAVDFTSLPGGGSTAIFIQAYAVGGSGPTSDPVTLTLSNGFSTTFSGGAIGISSPTPITFFNLTQTSQSSANGDGIWVYQVDLANAAPQTDPSQTPEAATLLLVGGGILIVFGAKRKFTNKFAF